MAIRAYIFIEAAVGKSREILSALNGLDEVRSVDMVTGPYDIIVAVEAKDLDSVGRIVTDRIQAVLGVLKTTTCLGIDTK